MNPDRLLLIASRLGRGPAGGPKAHGAIHEALVLQLSFKGGFPHAPLPVTGFRYSLMDPSPDRPREEMLERDTGRTLQAADEMADLTRAEIDHRSRLRCPLFRGAAALSVTRMLARKASASMARVMWRYQPCQDRIS